MNNWQSKLFNLKNIHEHFSVISYFVINIAGLCDCFDDWDICCYGCWCTARLYAQNAQQINGTNYDDAYYTYLNSGPDACPWVPVTATRRALRKKYGLPEEPCDDCRVIFWCAPCSVCQAARELKIRNNMLGECILLKTSSFSTEVKETFSITSLTESNFIYR